MITYGINSHDTCMSAVKIDVVNIIFLSPTPGGNRGTGSGRNNPLEYPRNLKRAFSKFRRETKKAIPNFPRKIKRGIKISGELLHSSLLVYVLFHVVQI